ncbi:hypothetical protein HMPREF9195_01610 [Treponema medium ATCC 700293]|uniref:Uncharacterized protein n=1 Tax=Treponema medium ATCC 700293 TaxID=1125700 RepID=A0AA87NLD2_TREMD|nr:hypothetical protein [Treponema medium]EPF28401.1 hypothetical protein HMPREF9195_01610 [Treponema medium ATCC 700293]
MIRTVSGSGSLAKIKLEGTLTPANGKAARITVPDGKYQSATQVLDGDIALGTPQNYTKFTVTPKGLEVWYITATGALKKR